MPELVTVKDTLDWSNANLAAYRVAIEQEPPRYTRKAWMVRAKLFKGLQSGTMSRASVYKNERAKLNAAGACSYCGRSGEKLTLDHLFPKSKGGSDSGDNLVYICVMCNSSKGAKDYFAWCAETGMVVNPDVAERYLKNAYRLCDDAEVLCEPQKAFPAGLLPFRLEDIPLRFELASKTVVDD